MQVNASEAKAGKIIGESPYFQLTENADLRIMTFNILTELWNSQIPVEGRDVIVADILHSFSPDVVGLQEVSDAWYRLLTPMIADDFTIIAAQNSDNETNFTPIAYNHHKVKLLDWGCEYFSQSGARQLRVISWGLFEQFSTAKRFVLMNTHWDGPKYRPIEADEMGQRSQELAKKFNCPVIQTGDFNSTAASEDFKRFMCISQAEHGQFNAKVKVGATDAPIDHIVYHGALNPLFFIRLSNPIIDQSSDHRPYFVDFKYE